MESSRRLPRRPVARVVRACSTTVMSRHPPLRPDWQVAAPPLQMTKCFSAATVVITPTIYGTLSIIMGASTGISSYRSLNLVLMSDWHPPGCQFFVAMCFPCSHTIGQIRINDSSQAELCFGILLHRYNYFTLSMSFFKIAECFRNILKRVGSINHRNDLASCTQFCDRDQVFLIALNC